MPKDAKGRGYRYRAKQDDYQCVDCEFSSATAAGTQLHWHYKHGERDGKKAKSPIAKATPAPAVAKKHEGPPASRAKVVKCDHRLRLLDERNPAHLDAMRRGGTKYCTRCQEVFA